MAAYVEEGAQQVILATHYNNRFASHREGYELTGLVDLIRSTCPLPSLAEDELTLQFRDALVGVKGRRNSAGFRQRRIRVIRRENLLQILLQWWASILIPS